MTTALLSQQVAISAVDDGTSLAMSQMVVIVADNSLPPADHDTMSQLPVIVANDVSDQIATVSQMAGIVANDVSDQIATVSQLVVIVADQPTPIVIALYPFALGWQPSVPMMKSRKGLNR